MKKFIKVDLDHFEVL